MSRHEKRFLDLIPAYVLGTLETSESLEVERHLESDCALCNAELLRSTRDLEALSETVPPVEPPAAILAELRSLIEESTPVPEVAPSSRRLWPVAAAIALLLLGWSVFSQLGLRRQVDTLTAQRSRDTATLERLESELASANLRLERFALANRIAASPELSTVRLAGLEAAPDASAQALVATPEARAVFYASNLEPLTPEQSYQLWIIIGGQPVSAGVFDVDAGGAGSLVIENLQAPGSIEAWAVTLEPAGGVEAPTGPMVLIGTTA